MKRKSLQLWDTEVYSLIFHLKGIEALTAAVAHFSMSRCPCYACQAWCQQWFPSPALVLQGKDWRDGEDQGMRVFKSSNSSQANQQLHRLSPLLGSESVNKERKRIQMQPGTPRTSKLHQEPWGKGRSRWVQQAEDTLVSAFLSSHWIFFFF